MGGEYVICEIFMPSIETLVGHTLALVMQQMPNVM
jgi:hypothetical protein